MWMRRLPLVTTMFGHPAAALNPPCAQRKDGVVVRLSGRRRSTIACALNPSAATDVIRTTPYRSCRYSHLMPNGPLSLTSTRPAVSSPSHSAPCVCLGAAVPVVPAHAPPGHRIRTRAADYGMMTG